MAEHTGRSYEAIAARYADTNDNPFTRLYERPGFVSQLPDLQGLSVLDAGCGPGWYSEFLIEQGADVTAFDLNAEFVQRTQARLGTGATVTEADITEPLDFLRNSAFDLVICPLVLHYVKDWQAPLAELHRVLKPAGMLVFSTHHPFTDWQQFDTESYFGLDLVEDEWDVGKVSFFRRPLSMISADLAACGFTIAKIHEPQPLASLRDSDEAQFERLMKTPMRLIITAVK